MSAMKRSSRKAETQGRDCGMKTAKTRSVRSKRSKRDQNKDLVLTSYGSALKFLDTLVDYEKSSRLKYDHRFFNLSRMQRLLSAVGRPHKRFYSVHIAGTKGKGSVAYMLSNALVANGYKVGLYTSPHLIDVRERIKINGEDISREEFVEYLNRLVSIFDRFSENNKPTFFEVITAIAFMYFADKQVDIAIVETGLGGRLDSTNIITPEVCLITSIDRDHVHILGDSLESIAREKAGIFKAGVPVISVPQVSEVKKVLIEQAREVKAPIKFIGEDVDFSYRFESSRLTGPHTRICLTSARSRFEHLPVPLPGEHQAVNCGLVLAAIDTLKELNWEIDDRKVIEGLSKTKLAGRMEMICTDPRVIIDGAHNSSSIEALIRTIGQHIEYDSLIIIFGCARDKDIDGMLEHIALGADKVIFTRSSSARAAEPEELAYRFEERTGRMAQWAPTLVDALRIASSVITAGDLICITGSFYLVGEAKRYFMERMRQLAG